MLSDWFEKPISIKYQNGICSFDNVNTNIWQIYHIQKLFYSKLWIRFYLASILVVKVKKWLGTSNPIKKI